MNIPTKLAILFILLVLAIIGGGGKANAEEIPPEVMAKLRAQIMADQAAIAETIRVPDVSRFPEHIQLACLVCHADKASMLKAADNVLTEEEMLMHTLFARGVEFHKPRGVNVILISPTDGVDVIKDPNEICVMWQRNYPDVPIEDVFYSNTTGKSIHYECQLIRES